MPLKLEMWPRFWLESDFSWIWEKQTLARFVAESWYSRKLNSWQLRAKDAKKSYTGM